jgi:hypothetical protein
MPMVASRSSSANGRSLGTCSGITAKQILDDNEHDSAGDVGADHDRAVVVTHQRDLGLIESRSSRGKVGHAQAEVAGLWSLIRPSPQGLAFGWRAGERIDGQCHVAHRHACVRVTGKGIRLDEGDVVAKQFGESPG